MKKEFLECAIENFLSYSNSKLIIEIICHAVDECDMCDM